MLSPTGPSGIVAGSGAVQEPEASAGEEEFCRAHRPAGPVRIKITKEKLKKPRCRVFTWIAPLTGRNKPASMFEHEGRVAGYHAQPQQDHEHAKYPAKLLRAEFLG